MMPTIAITNMPAASIGSLTLGTPLLAWGLIACAIPIIIHLVLRQKPRRQIFPAMRFLMKASQSSTRTHNLKHLLLMLCRMSLVLLLVAALMKTGCSSGHTGLAEKWLGPAKAPVSAVFCLDDSAGMGYRFQGQTRLRRAADWTRNLLHDRARIPQGSQIAIVIGSANQKDISWTRNLAHADRILTNIQPADHDRTVSVLLKKAYHTLTSADLPRREVYLFTDLTQQSWRDPLPQKPEELNAVYILDLGRDENLNVALGSPDLPNRPLPAGVTSTIPLRIRTGNLPADVTIELTIDGQPRDRRPINKLKPDSEVQIDLTLPAMNKGIHALTIDMYPPDALNCDNRRFALLEVDDPKNVIIATNNPHNQTALMMSAMVQPPTLPQSKQRFFTRQLLAGQITETQPQDVLAVFLVDIETIDANTCSLLSKYVAQGGTLIIIPGPNFSPQTCKAAEQLMPAHVLAVTECSPPVRLTATDLDHPYLKPFKDPAVDSINDRLIFKRLKLAPPTENSAVIVPFGNNEPALIEKRLGTGRIILFAFSPETTWSQMGSQAAPMLVLVHTILENLIAPASKLDSYGAGRTVHKKIPNCDNTTTYLLHTPEKSKQTIETDNCNTLLQTKTAGHYRICEQKNDQTTLLEYTVNVPETESDARRIDNQTVQSLFPPQTVILANSPEKLTSAHYQANNGINLIVPLALALLGAIFVESLFANRFYGFANRVAKHQ